MSSAPQRRYLMCPPTYFDVAYRINPWMNPGQSCNLRLATAQWRRLHDCYLDLGHHVDVIDGVPDLPDMVFAANGATIIGGEAYGARFLHPQRRGEAGHYRRWLEDTAKLPFTEPQYVNEGEGDFLLVGSTLLAGHGFRTDPRAHAEVQELFRLPVVSLALVDPMFYHLDTALAVLDASVAYYPGAFDQPSLVKLRELFPDAIEATEVDAMLFALNAVCDGRNVVAAAGAKSFHKQLTRRGYNVIEVDMSEFSKAGGGIKCCTLEVRT